VSSIKRKPYPVTTTAKGLRARDEERSKMAVRTAEMDDLLDFYDAPERETWEVGAGNSRGARRA
jgi:hypothetical protein